MRTFPFPAVLGSSQGPLCAPLARAQAEAAFFAGDRQAYDWWLGITRTLDRRLAAEAERPLAALIPAAPGSKPGLP